MSKALLVVEGLLGADVEVKDLGDKSVAKFSVATNFVVKGERQTQWWSVSAFGKAGEFAANYLKKGSSVLVTGEPRLNLSSDGKLFANLTASSVDFSGRAVAQTNSDAASVPGIDLSEQL